jgi:hypothetical protein
MTRVLVGVGRNSRNVTGVRKSFAHVATRGTVPSEKAECGATPPTAASQQCALAPTP